MPILTVASAAEALGQLALVWTCSVKMQEVIRVRKEISEKPTFWIWILVPSKGRVRNCNQLHNHNFTRLLTHKHFSYPALVAHGNATRQGEKTTNKLKRNS